MEDYKTGHRQRLRSRAEDSSLDALRPHEILELMLCYAVPRVDMSETARILLKKFGSLKNVLNATPAELMTVKGVGKSVVEWIGMVRELVEAYSAMDPSDHHPIVGHTDALQYVLSFREKLTPPCCLVIHTDFNRRVIMKDLLCPSLDWAQPEYTRKIITEAIALQSKSVFLVLFMPNAPLDLDESDLKNLFNLARSLRTIHVELLDCILCGAEDIKSLNALGIMNVIRGESKNAALHEDYVQNRMDENP